MSSQLPVYSSCLHVEDKNAFKLFVALRKTGPVARALGSIVRQLNKCGSVSVEQYCKETLKYNSKAYEKAFNKDERDLLESGSPWEELDITLLYKLLQQICELAPRGNIKWNSQTDDPDCLEYSLTKLKNVRNRVVHNLASISSSELSRFFTDIIKLLENVFVKVGEKLGKDLNLQSRKVTKEIQSLLTSPLPHSNIQEYQQSLEETQKDLIEVTLSEGQLDLRKLYMGAWVVSPIPWSHESIYRDIEINKIYTSLQLETSSAVDIKKLLVLELSDGSTPHVICLSGIAGAGKTSLCSYLLYSWCQDPMLIEGMADVDFLYLIQCRYVRYELLVDYIRNEFMPNACGNLDYSDISPTLKKCKNIFIFDGFDEANPKAKELFQEALCWPSHTRVIVTSRPEFMNDAKELITGNLSTRSLKSLTVNISGFEEAKKKEYIVKLFSVLVSDDSERIPKMDAFLKYFDNIEEIIRSSLQLPLTLSLMVYLWLEDESKVHCIHTITGLYLELIRLSLHRLAKRLQQGSCKRFDEILDDCYNRFLSELCKEAYSQLRKFQVCIDEKGVERIQKICSPDIDTTQALSSLLHYQKPIVQTDSRKCWVFPHKTFQEVLAGYFVHNCYRENMILPEFEATSKNRPFGTILIRAVGLMYLQKPEPDYVNIKKVVNLIDILYDDRRDTVNSFYLSGLILKETEGSLIGKEIAKKLISSHSIPKRISLDHVSLEQLFTVLQHIDVTVPDEICLECIGSSRNCHTEIIHFLKKQNVVLNLIYYQSNNDVGPEIFNEFMACSTIDIKQLSRIDDLREIGEIWASQIRNKSEVSLAVTAKNLDLEVKLSGEEQIPQIKFFSKAEWLYNFFMGIQKVGICFQKGSLRFEGFITLMIDTTFCHIFMSQFPFILPKIIPLDYAYIDANFLMFAQKVKERCSSLRIENLHIKGCDHIFHLQSLFDIIDCDLKVDVIKDIEKPVQSLASIWAKKFISQSGSGNTVYNVEINQSGSDLTISVIVSCLKKYREISLSTSFHQEGNVPILDKYASIVVGEVEKVGIRNDGQTVCNLSFSIDFSYSTELVNMIEKWAPAYGKGIFVGKVTIMETASLSTGMASLVEYLDSRGFERNEFPQIVVCDSECLQLLTENISIAMKLYKEHGIILDFRPRSHLCPIAVQQFCQGWISAVGSSHKVRLHLSCPGQYYEDPIQLSIEVQTLNSFHFLRLQQRGHSEAIAMVISALLKELEKASVPVHKGQMTFGFLSLNTFQVEVIANILSSLPFSIEEPVIIRGPVHNDGFKKMCRIITELGSSVHLRGISLTSHDLSNIFPNMEWIRKMLLDEKLKLGIDPCVSETELQTFAQGWAERLPHVDKCALKLICECSSEALSFIISVQSEMTLEVLELYSAAGRNNDNFMFRKLLETCPSFLRGFREGGGSLALGHCEIIASDLMTFDTQEFIRFLYNLPLKLCKITEFTKALMDVSLISLMNQVEDKGSVMRISDCLVLDSKSLPLVCKYMSSVTNMFVNGNLVFELQRGAMPNMFDFKSFGCKWLESGDIPLSVNLSVNCWEDAAQIVCSIKEEAPCVPTITWRQKLVQDDCESSSKENWTTILEILIPFLEGIQTAGVKMEDCLLVFEGIAFPEFSCSFVGKLQSIPVTLGKLVHIQDAVIDEGFISLLDFLASQGIQVRITGELILCTEDSLLLFISNYEKIQRIFPDHVLKLFLTDVEYIFDETFHLLIRMWLSPLQSPRGSEKLEIKLTSRDEELSLECSISGREELPKIMWLGDSKSCKVMVWAKILASFIEQIRLTGIAVDELGFGRLDLVTLTPVLLIKVIDILLLEKQAIMNLSTVKINKVVIDLIKTMSVKIDCFVLDNDVDIIVLIKDFEEVFKTVRESKLVLYLSVKEFSRKLPVYVFGEKWASNYKVLTDAKVIIDLTCEDEEISVTCSLGNRMKPDIQWKTDLENIEVIGEVVRIFLDGVQGSGVKNVVLSQCCIDHMDFADEFVNSLLKKIKAKIICEVQIKSIEINEDSKILLNHVKFEHCKLRIIDDYEIACVHDITLFVDNFRKWVKFSGGSRLSVLATFDFFSDVEPLKRLGHTWVTDLIFPRTNKLDVHFSYEEGTISLEFKVCGPDTRGIPTFVWKTYQGNGKVLAQVVNYFLEGVHALGVPMQKGVLSYNRDEVMSLPQDELRNLLRTLSLHTAN